MSAIRTIRLDLQYDGTDFVGWQIQQNGRSVQGELARALQQILQEISLVPIGSGRTDAGTHALGQVAHFQTKAQHPSEQIYRALNSLLPPDISVSSVHEVDNCFHARYSAVSKRYRYRISTVKAPIKRRWVWTIPRRLDFDAMQEAGELFKGSHKFYAFCNQHPVPKSFSCTILDCNWKICDAELQFVIEGNRFLRHMVRIMVGTMVEVGLGRRNSNLSIPLNAKLDSNDVSLATIRKQAGPTAPAHGLCLVEVNYGDQSC